MGTVVQLKNRINNSYSELKNSVDDKLVLVEERIKSKKFTLIGLKMNDKTIPRSGYKILSKNKIIGHVTSGTFSPILKRGICLGLIEYQCVDFNEFQIEIRKKYEDAEKVKYPFIR